MNKKQFKKMVNVNSELAEEAWNQARGDADRAKKLIKPAKLWVKGRFSNSNRSGLFIVEMNCRERRVYNLDCVVVSRGNVEGASPRLSPKKFGKKIKSAARSSDHLEAPTDRLQSALEEFWADDDSRPRQAVKDEEFESLPNIHRSLLDDTLDFEVADREITFTLRRVIDLDEEIEESEDDVIVLPCDVSINPVAGLNFSKLNKGDEILVTPEEPEGNSEVRSAFQKVKNNTDSEGRIPAKLKSGKKTDSGDVVLKMELLPGIWGETKCGQDVSLLVSEKTARKKGMKSSEGSLAAVKENILPIIMLLGAAGLLVVAAIYLF